MDITVIEGAIEKKLPQDDGSFHPYSTLINNPSTFQKYIDSEDEML